MIMRKKYSTNSLKFGGEEPKKACIGTSRRKEIWDDSETLIP